MTQMTALKVRKIGSSLGVILPRDVLAQLRDVGEGDTIFVTKTPDGVRLTPFDPEFEQQIAIAREVMKEDRDMLRELAKS